MSHQNNTSPSTCSDLLDKYYWDVVETNPDCIEWLVQQCKESNMHDDRLFCKSSIDLQCKPCMAYLHKSMPKDNQCYTELSTLCTDPIHQSSKFCVEHNDSLNNPSPNQENPATEINHKTTIWQKVFCKCNYLDDVNTLVMRRMIWIIIMMLVSLLIVVYFN